MKRTDLPFRPEFFPMIADGRKTQTRRCSGLATVNKNPDEWIYGGENVYGQYIFYNKDKNKTGLLASCPWVVGTTYPPAGFKVGSIRAERVQSISESDAAAEGWVKQPERSRNPDVHRDAARDWFSDIWDTIHRRDLNNRWERNPWCWRIEKAK